MFENVSLHYKAAWPAQTSFNIFVKNIPLCDVVHICRVVIYTVAYFCISHTGIDAVLTKNIEAFIRSVIRTMYKKYRYWKMQ
jgi:hypothetical protein